MAAPAQAAAQSSAQPPAQRPQAGNGMKYFTFLGHFCGRWGTVDGSPPHRAEMSCHSREQIASGCVLPLSAPQQARGRKAIEKVLNENAKLRLARSEPASGSDGRGTAQAASASVAFLRARQGLTLQVGFMNGASSSFAPDMLPTMRTPDPRRAISCWVIVNRCACPESTSTI